MNSLEKYVRFRYSRRICARLKLYRIFEFLAHNKRTFLKHALALNIEQLGETEKHIFLESKPLKSANCNLVSFVHCAYILLVAWVALRVPTLKKILSDLAG